MNGRVCAQRSGLGHFPAVDITLIVVLVIALALFFDFTNGFHDTANAMATPIATGAMKPKVAVTVAAVLNLIGAFLSTAVATSTSHGLINEGPGGVAITPEMIFAGLIGAAIVGAGFGAVNYAALLTVVIIPAFLSPVIAALVSLLATRIAYRVTRRPVFPNERGGFRIGQVFTSSMVSLAHGTNDAQKTMGVITLTLIASGAQSADSGVQFWVIVACALAIALGTYTGGWRIIRTLGSGITEIRATQGFAAEASTAATILASSHLGFALSTTQVSSGSIIGAGLGRRGSKIQWSTAGKIVIAWFITLPAAAAVGAVASGIALLGVTGLVIDAVVGAAVILGLYLWSLRKPHEQAIEVDVAANAVFTRKELRDMQRKKRAARVAERRAELSRERTLRRMAGRNGGRR
ncbi:phosphate transporter [Curtobacterium citreum]|nr:PiT family inorganic phosphate transporter [Curtobacterium citreum]GGL78026.1 phosphate transporter [Curtobacterium citreum]